MFAWLCFIYTWFNIKNPIIYIDKIQICAGYISL